MAFEHCPWAVKHSVVLEYFRAGQEHCLPAVEHLELGHSQAKERSAVAQEYSALVCSLAFLSNAWANRLQISSFCQCGK